MHSSHGCVGERTDWRGPYVTKTQLGEHDVVRPMVADKHVFRQVVCVYLVVNVALTPVWSVTPCCLLTRAGWKIRCATLGSSRRRNKAGADIHYQLIGHQTCCCGTTFVLVYVAWQGRKKRKKKNCLNVMCSGASFHCSGVRKAFSAILLVCLGFFL